MTLERGQSAGLSSGLFQPVIEFYGLYGFSGSYKPQLLSTQNVQPRP